MQKNWEKRQFFRRKVSKIAENCDHNIDPRFHIVETLEILVLEEAGWKEGRIVSSWSPAYFVF
jgi:hypothetical protein